MRPPNCTRPPPIVARQIVEPDAARVELDAAVDRVERVGQREVADAAVGDRRAAGEDRLVERAVDRRGRARRGPEPRTSRKNPCRMPRFASPAACERDPLDRADRRRPPTRSCVSSPTSCSSSICTCLLVERDADRRRVLERVVEQPHVERVDRAVDEQMIESASSPATRIEPLATAVVNGDRLRHEQPHVRIERAVVEAERQLGVGLGRQRDAAGAGDAPAAATRRRSRRSAPCRAAPACR